MTYTERKEAEKGLLARLQGKRGTLRVGERTFRDVWVYDLTIASDGLTYIAVKGGSIYDMQVTGGWHNRTNFEVV